MKSPVWLAVGAAVVMVAGCVSTPERRIAKHPELFASYPQEVQDQIRAGKVAVGFTFDMVRFALGRPDRVHSRMMAAGETEVWTYTGIMTESSLVPVGGSYAYRDRYGRLRRASDAGWVTVDRTREYPILRLEFEDGKVKAIEKAKPGGSGAVMP